jgi:hypothetical protein
MKRILLIAIALLCGFLIASAAWYYSRLHSGKSGSIQATAESAVTAKLMNKLNRHSDQLLLYARQHGYNTNTCFLIDMSIESGRNRFFVFDMQKHSILKAGLVAHGCCNKSWLSGRQYGNEVGCGCTSLGKYKIGAPYKGRFGLAYKLYGLDATNSNAFARAVVLHSYYAVPDKEVHPYPICQSEGCPMVSAAFLNKLAGIINASKKPMLLYTFDAN